MKFRVVYTKVAMMDVEDKFAPLLDEYNYDEQLTEEFWQYANQKLGLDGSDDECVCCLEREDGEILAEW